MSKILDVRAEMTKAMKEKNAPRKDALSMLLAALLKAEKEKREPLTEEEENTIIQKELKQTKETLDTAPDSRPDIKEEATYRISVLSEFAPQMMGEDEIKATIAKVLADIGMENPEPSQKGLIMKNLMPLVKGKADGALVNKLVGELFH